VTAVDYPSIPRRAIPKHTPGTFAAASTTARMSGRDGDFDMSQQLYEFSIIVAGEPELTDELADRLFAVGADDCSPSVCERIMTIGFSREAESLEQAIRSAIAHVQAAGLTAERVEMDADLPALRT
jgi:hypothetical protein